MEKVSAFIGKGLPDIGHNMPVRGWSVYKNVLVVWDEDNDDSVLYKVKRGGL